ncbi:uncharacterized protein LOC110854459 [Folsomia candida]|uniref:Uncharacterized protein n=1 Tax=Folsomia candida TaxID=158441 RepID=A0A226DX87_FOLCA|nr:uncharacterized protein LOC110854459 [Folsomia candida]OXA49414.1 hypothetical protein Fcan01_15885 [Folsomia candida]
MRGVDWVLLIEICHECSELKWECICSDNDAARSDDDDDAAGSNDDDDKDVANPRKSVLDSSDDDDDQDVAKPNDTAYWKEFAILPYQDRRKFTLGTKFTSWEDQGEFIFLNIEHSSSGYDSDSFFDNSWAMRSASLVEISCTNGEYYIMPMRGTKHIVNGENKTCSCGQHHSSFRLELNFGDRFELSVGDGAPVRLLFKERTFKPDIDKDEEAENKEAEEVSREENNVDFSPGRNQLVVTKLQDTLQELILDMDMSLLQPNGEEAAYQIATNLDFKHLRAFTFFLNGNYLRNTDFASLNLAWLTAWASAIKKIQSITIHGDPVLSSFLVDHMQTVGPSSYPNLTQVSTPFIHEAGPVLDFLLGLEQPLTSLSLPILVKMQDFQNFEKLMEKNGKTLKHLELVVSTCGEDGQFGVTLRLPALPKLERLDFWVKRGSDEGVTLIFPGDAASMSYKAHLPSIRSLRIYPTDRNWRVSRFKSGRQYREKYGGFLDTFLPKKDEEICTTLKYLDIPYEMGRDPYPRGAELPGMFPNVENEFMTKFRKRPPPPPATKTYWLRSKVKK